MLQISSRPRKTWSDRRILMLVALATLIVTVIWHLPAEASYLGARMGELLFALTLAMAMTYVLRPGVNATARALRMDKNPKGRSWATLIVFAACILLIWIMVWATVRPVTRDLRALWPKEPTERSALVFKWKESVRKAAQPYRDFLPKDALDDPEFLSDQGQNILKGAGNWLREQSSHAGFLVELLLVPVLAFYFLADGAAIRREAKLLVPVAWRPRLARMGEHFDYVLDGYVVGQAWMCIIAWVLVTIVLWILKVPHAITLGLIAGITRAVPVIGPILGAVPLLLVCLIYTQSVQTTSILLFAFFMMHFLESKVLLPKIVGHHVDLHPVSVILSILIGLEFFGFIGVFLAVPIAAVIKIVLLEYHRAQEVKAAKVGALPEAHL